MRLNTDFYLFIYRLPWGCLMVFKRKQKLRTWRGLHSLPPEWLPHRVTIESTDTSTNEYTSFIKESWKEQNRPPLLRQAA